MLKNLTPMKDWDYYYGKHIPPALLIIIWLILFPIRVVVLLIVPEKFENLRKFFIFGN